MPEYLAPGVYIEELQGVRPIEGVGTSTAGFAGPTERGPEAPQLITSWLDYQRWYGSYAAFPDVGGTNPPSYLAYAVQGFFENGGQRAYVARVIGGAAASTTGAQGNLQIGAIGRGAWGNGLIVKIDRVTQPPTQPDWFRLTVMYYRPGRLAAVMDAGGVLNTDKLAPPFWVDPTSTLPADVADQTRRLWVPDLLEVFDNLTHEAGASNEVAQVVNTNSRLVRVWWDGQRARLADRASLGLGNNGADAPVAAGDYDGVRGPLAGPTLNTPATLFGSGRGLEGLASIDPITILMAPDEVQANMDEVTSKVLNQCELLKDRFAVLSVDRGVPDVDTVQTPRDTSYGAFYYPWIRVFDPSINGTRLIPPTGHVAGVYARTDVERGVHKAPANEVVRGVVTTGPPNEGPLEFPVTKGMQDMLNPRGVNCIRDFRADRRGVRVWGARTMASDAEFKYVNVRRFFIYLEESIEEGTQWVVFEPNDESTWAKVRRSVSSFLTRAWRSGALVGASEEEAFFVRCDRTTMTQDDIDNGRLVCYIGVCPSKPAEFVIFRISQITAGAAA